ncbi:hypothetical protein WH96_04955 [Kiloniella spongiae]|uniref:Rap1a immunity protein domain-containing protein n=1 Tax=Kiloniella spongiae TaxID=1489064 RepID=A0A0H2MY88_9PROT|nr:Rap1a/Tai family immunity protein [Kiloniella spongiae]KLN61685.1 hypothetical protein WH96_04955 [Kiloniella spongiae]
MIKKFVIIVTFMLLGTSYSSAFPTQGDLIYDTCKSGKQVAERVYLKDELLTMPGNFLAAKKGIYCAGYIMAAEDDLREKGIICLPPHSSKASINAVIDYFEKHPELQKENARVAVDAAIKAKFPCP